MNIVKVKSDCVKYAGNVFHHFPPIVSDTIAIIADGEGHSDSRSKCKPEKNIFGAP